MQMRQRTGGHDMSSQGWELLLIFTLQTKSNLPLEGFSLNTATLHFVCRAKKGAACSKQKHRCEHSDRGRVSQVMSTCDDLPACPVQSIPLPCPEVWCDMWTKVDHRNRQCGIIWHKCNASGELKMEICLRAIRLQRLRRSLACGQLYRSLIILVEPNKKHYSHFLPTKTT